MYDTEKKSAWTLTSQEIFVSTLPGNSACQSGLQSYSMLSISPVYWSMKWAVAVYCQVASDNQPRDFLQTFSQWSGQARFDSRIWSHGRSSGTGVVSRRELTCIHRWDAVHLTSNSDQATICLDRLTQELSSILIVSSITKSPLLLLQPSCRIKN